jgi:hypothetical protein
MRQQWLLRRLRRLREQRAAMAVGRGDEASSHVLGFFFAATKWPLWPQWQPQSL